jgi:hypothetical protein
MFEFTFISEEDERDGWNSNSWPKADTAEGFKSVIEDDNCIPVPAPVWSIEGKKIAPVDYEKWLKNAIVEAWFQLEHCIIKNKAVYTPVLYHLRVLKEPPARETIEYFEKPDFEGGSPKKKRKKNSANKR